MTGARPGAGYRLAQLANYVGPSSGGLAVAVDAVGAQHTATGGCRLVVAPGPATAVTQGVGSTWVTLDSPLLPGSGGGHHVLLRRRDVRRRLEAFGPDLIEVHDQTTLTWALRWARVAGVPSVVFVHEYLPQIVDEVAPLAPRSWRQAVSRRWIGRVAAGADAVVCASDFAAGPYLAAGARVHRIALGADLEVFRPRPRQPVTRPWGVDVLRLLCASRLYPEKNLDLVLSTVAALRDRGAAVELVLIGAGPREAALRERVRAERLPVRMLGKVGREQVSELMAAADVVLAMGWRETFGLAALEAMASGTPVVVSDTGASRELLAPGVGLTAASPGEAAAAVLTLVAGGEAARRAARARAEQFPWSAATARLRELEASLVARSRGLAPAGVGDPRP